MCGLSSILVLYYSWIECNSLDECGISVLYFREEIVLHLALYAFPRHLPLIQEKRGDLFQIISFI